VSALLTSKSTEYETPGDFYEWLNSQFAFTVDVAANALNRKHPRFYGAKVDGLRQLWEGETVWCNPPYGKGIGAWLQKARSEAMLHRCLTCLLLPARVDAEWWRVGVMSDDASAGRLRHSEYSPASRVLWLRWEKLLTGVYFHDSRLTFGEEKSAAPFPSAVVIHAHPSRRPVGRPVGVNIIERWPK
jgi:hypothetical protein